MSIIEKVRRNIELLQGRLGSPELPPFPKVAEQRTHYGWCLRRAFTVGEWQDKIYRLAREGVWYQAADVARRLVDVEEDLQRTCGVDTRRARHYLEKIREAIERKDWRKVDELIMSMILRSSRPLKQRSILQGSRSASHHPSQKRRLVRLKINKVWTSLKSLSSRKKERMA